MDGASPNQLPTLAAGTRIGDAERDDAASALSEHFSAGRLDRAEFDVRLHAAYAAQTAADLAPLFADLPRPGLPFVRATAAVPKRTPALRGHRHGPSLFGVLIPILLVVGIVTTLSSLSGHTHFPIFLIPAIYFMGGFRFLGRLGRRRVW